MRENFSIGIEDGQQLMRRLPDSQRNFIFLEAGEGGKLRANFELPHDFDLSSEFVALCEEETLRLKIEREAMDKKRLSKHKEFSEKAIASLARRKLRSLLIKAVEKVNREIQQLPLRKSSAPSNPKVRKKLQKIAFLKDSAATDLQVDLDGIENSPCLTQMIQHSHRRIAKI